MWNSMIFRVQHSPLDGVAQIFQGTQDIIKDLFVVSEGQALDILDENYSGAFAPYIFNAMKDDNSTMLFVLQAQLQSSLGPSLARCTCDKNST